MVRNLMHDPLFLAQRSEAATEADAPVARDLQDTLLAHQDSCVGMAANMIGVKKRIICFFNGFAPMTMYNPVILEKSGRYDAEEGCLSLLGGPRKCVRYQKIRVRWQDGGMKVHEGEFSGWTAEIIQHEVDHLEGILI